MLANEWAILRAAKTGIRTVFAAPAPQAQSYVEKNMLGMFALVLAVGALPEIPLHHLLFGRNWPLAAALDFAVIYAPVWLFGVYGSMAQRPHNVTPDALAFHRGPFSHVRTHRDNVAQATVVSEEPRQAKRRYRNAGYLGVPGTPLVHLRLKEPARVVHTYPVSRELHVHELLVPSDRPHELCALLSE